ncbi:MAG: phosphoglycerate kinase [Acidobacteriota bacterium]
MDKMTIRDFPLKDRRVFLRVDFNVPLKEGTIKDDRRIRESLPTIDFLIEQGVKLIIASHLGRPGGKVIEEMSLEPVSTRLAQLTGKKVKMAPDCIGEETRRMAMSLAPGDMLLLENLRFHPEEEKNDPGFSKELACLADVYVNDAFGAAHRAHASVEGIGKFLKPCLAGFLMEKELKYLSEITGNPKHPFVTILGGAKVSDKIKLINNLLRKVDKLLIGGAMAYTFMKAQGIPVGNSLTEEDRLELANSILEKCREHNIQMILPLDHIVVDDRDGEKVMETLDENIGEGRKGMDIGPKTISTFEQQIADAETIFWNGPMGVFENDLFSEGTRKVALAIAASKGLSVVGGGDSAAALKKFGLEEGIDHISTGGGASLEFVSGIPLPGILVLTDK